MMTDAEFQEFRMLQDLNDRMRKRAFEAEEAFEQFRREWAWSEHDVPPSGTQERVLFFAGALERIDSIARLASEEKRKAQEAVIVAKGSV